MNKRTWLLASACAALLAMSTATPARADESSSLPKPTMIDAGPPKNFAGWQVVHWTPEASSQPLDASKPANRSQQRFLDQNDLTLDRTRSNVRSTTRVTEWSCSLYVGKTKLTDDNVLHAWTAQRCRGDYGTQGVDAQFEYQDASTWEDYSGTTSSDGTTRKWHYLSWSFGCERGTTSHYYRLEANGWAGGNVPSATVHGRAGGPFACGP